MTENRLSMQKFYHVSFKDLGEVFKFKPKVPGSALVSKEGNIPRVCVCPDIYFCLRALVSGKSIAVNDTLIETFNDSGVFLSPVVYSTEKIPFTPPNVSDFKRNKEGWFITPVSMTRVGFIDMKELLKGIIKITDNINSVTDLDLRNVDLTIVIKKETNHDRK